ncbi:MULTISPECIES: DUF2891 domain-containing protein [unclassified Sphingomonas]|uniref:DUF2891 domain-containing protein n=1 Tax=unclassified Sphingomonas TaxID=196159 RepID=UPI0006FF8111|nr:MULTISPECIES: DUF2891 domain-containing protein [unclassified Sphingomonas]KQX20897.1 hypothetical protein ASD17_08420 [Sphingomonas sp. Root1294]KQY68743.1 hypothetical protein ASD39_04935 [Sphingomonas sp. Root50]KRB88149.1 hypothetical protein ASE22_22110 [Sphingomonas sp. Root720]
MTLLPVVVTPDLAARFAALTLGHLGRAWPYKLDHVMAGPEDVLPPATLHPIFHGSFDWHSCVHGWWQVMRLLRRFPDLPQAGEIRARADAMLVPDKVAGELAYLDRPASAGFERPYGWGWLLALHHELGLHDDRHWCRALEPLARAFADRFRAYLPRLTYPIRVGTHPNSSFALIHAHRWAVAHDRDLAALIAARAADWYGADRGCQAWEPGGDEFLSSALTEAHLMCAVLPAADFPRWFGDFLPEVPATLLTPAFVSDRTDGKIAHLDGLNLSRAWSWRAIAAGLPGDHPVVPVALEAAERHVAAALPHLADHYMGEHWLASFALLALDQD